VPGGDENSTGGIDASTAGGGVPPGPPQSCESSWVEHHHGGGELDGHGEGGVQFGGALLGQQGSLLVKHGGGVSMTSGDVCDGTGTALAFGPGIVSLHTLAGSRWA
jgi:hypothetical protein